MQSKKEQQSFQVTDRRFWVQDHAAVEEAPLPEQRFPSVVEELKARTELAEKRLREKLDELERENEAFRARLRRELERRYESEKVSVLKEFLEVVDNLERALDTSSESSEASLREGVELNLRLLLAKLKESGIEPIEVAGHVFDPHVAEAVGTVFVSGSEQDQVVLEVVLQGYRWGEQLLRPARVRVGYYQAGSSDSQD